jgi:hypothetical protein
VVIGSISNEQFSQLVALFKKITNYNAEDEDMADPWNGKKPKLMRRVVLPLFLTRKSRKTRMTRMTRVLRLEKSLMRKRTGSKGMVTL